MASTIRDDPTQDWAGKAPWLLKEKWPKRARGAAQERDRSIQESWWHMHFVFILISMACLGITNFLFKFSSTSLGPTRSTFYYYLFGLGLSCIALLVDKSKREYMPQDLVVPALISAFLFVSILTYNYALNNMAVSKASTIRSLSFIVTVVLAVVVTKEKLILKDYLAIGLASGAIFLLGWPSSTTRP